MGTGDFCGIYSLKKTVIVFVLQFSIDSQSTIIQKLDRFIYIIISFITKQFWLLIVLINIVM